MLSEGYANDIRGKTKLEFKHYFNDYHMDVYRFKNKRC